VAKKRIAVAADAVVFLDLPIRVCLWSVVRRRFEYARRVRPDMAPDCPEKLDWDFLTFIWSFPKQELPKMRERLSRLAPSQTVITLRSRSAVQAFLDRVRTTRELA
jgi:adenylate kinase family enzyme